MRKKEKDIKFCVICSLELTGIQRKFCSKSCCNKAYHVKHRERRNRKNLERYFKNHEYNLQKKKEYYLDNKKRVLESHKKWREENPEKRKKYYLDNKENIIEKVRKWRKDHPEKRAENNSKRRSLLKGQDFHFNSEDIRDKIEFYENRCFYCKEELDKYHVDHMWPLSRGGSNTWENIAIACPTCNLSKGTKTAEEFMEVLNGKA